MKNYEEFKKHRIGPWSSAHSWRLMAADGAQFMKDMVKERQGPTEEDVSDHLHRTKRSWKLR